MISPAIELNNISMTLRGEKVLDNITATFNLGDFVGVIGPNGGGKTTLLKIILGLLKPDQGTVKLLGDLPKKNRHRLGYVPQYARFNFAFPISVLEVVLMGRLAANNYFRGYSAEDKTKALGALEKVGLATYAQRQVGKLSGGELQRVLIARALAVEPEVLLLDEPTASLDTPIGQSIYKLLEESSQKMCIVLVSHDIGVISRHVKTIACLNRCLHYHQSDEISSKTLEEVYGCPVELIAHGQAHRVLATHDHTDHDKKKK